MTIDYTVKTLSLFYISFIEFAKTIKRRTVLYELNVLKWTTIIKFQTYIFVKFWKSFSADKSFPCTKHNNLQLLAIVTLLNFPKRKKKKINTVIVILYANHNYLWCIFTHFFKITFKIMRSVCEFKIFHKALKKKNENTIQV